MEKYWLWICSIPGIYQKQIMLLISYFGSPREVYYAPDQEYDVFRERNMHWVDLVLDFRKKCSPEEAGYRVQRGGIQFISREHGSFPERLKHLTDCPAGLFYLGRLPETDCLSAAVVGARRCSHYGWTMAGEIGTALARAGIQVISGMASGIDGRAQQAALEAGGASFGVLGCGVDICYPEENRNLYRQLAERGGVLSEYPPGTPPMKRHFPMRNRIISGLSDAVAVVEAREKSGSLITADLALEQGKDVYAVPGRSGDALSCGCNRLIQQGAGLILSPESLPAELKPELRDCKFLGKNQLGLAPEEKWVYSNLDLLPESLEELMAKTDLPLGQLSGILLCLELKGLAAEISKNHYARLK